MSAVEQLPEPAAIEPSRVLELREDQQRFLLSVLVTAGQSDGAYLAAAGDDAAPEERAGFKAIRGLHSLIAYGEEYINEEDEHVRTTLRKRRLEAEVRRCNIRIAQLDEQLADEWAAAGRTKSGHAATGASLSLNSMIWAKLDVDTDGLTEDEARSVKAAVKGRAGEVLIDIGMDELVKPDFNLATLSAVIREEVKAYRKAQLELPEHERVPRTAQSFLPEALQGLIRIDDTPHIQVRA